MKKRGEIITFYSFKGGTGRTMALANIAVLYAQKYKGIKKILMIDWDMEAPGLHRYFDPKIENANGLLELFHYFQKRILFPDNPDSGEWTPEKIKTLLAEINWSDYMYLVNGMSNLWLMPAGRHDSNYSSQVHKLQWSEMFDKAPDFFMYFAQKLYTDFDFVLIDSRTGFTDTAGICTRILPEKLVVVFTPNTQNLYGGVEQMKKAINVRLDSDDLRPFVIYPLPSRIENSEKERKIDWLKKYKELFQTELSLIYKDEINLDVYFGQVYLPHDPYFAYGEEIAVLIEDPNEPGGLSPYYQLFFDRLEDEENPWNPKETENHLNDLFNKGMGAYQEEKYSETIEILSELLETSPHHPMALTIWINLARSYYNTRQYEKAIAAYCKVIELDSFNSWAFSWAGSAYRILEKYEEAEIFSLNALSIDPKNFIANINLASIYVRNKAPEKALPYAKAAFLSKPEDTHALNILGVIYFDLKEFQLAKEKFVDALKYDTNNDIIWTNLGNANSKLNLIEEALNNYTKSIELKPENEATWVKLGSSYILNKQYDKGFDIFEKILLTNPNLVIAWYDKSCAHALLLQKEEALKALRRAIELEIGNWEKAQTDSDFDALRDDPDFKALIDETNPNR